MVEYSFDLRAIFPDRITKVTSNYVPPKPKALNIRHDLSSNLCQVIYDLGCLSATAQDLRKPITSLDRLRQYEDQVLYILSDLQKSRNGKAFGFLKIGYKDLYLANESGKMRYMRNTPAILDFYVHESLQRRGYGKELFDFMLKDQSMKPFNYCIDRPSHKMLSFLRKHYKLDKPIQQSNHFVLYQGFFEDERNVGKDLTMIKPQQTNGLRDFSMTKIGN